MTISVPEGYVLKAVDGIGTLADATTVPLVDSLSMLSADGSAYGYLFTMPAADVNVGMVLKEIPAGSTVVKFIKNGDLYDYVIVEKGTNGAAPAVAPTKEGATFKE